MRRAKKLTARYAGHCPACSGPIEVGDRIWWFGRGRGAQHVDCEVARLRHEGCTACGGSGSFRDAAYSRPCRSCDGTGLRSVQELAKRAHELHPAPARDPMGVDLAYEDSCARQCGL